MELFLPKTVVSSESQATFKDYHTYSSSGNPVYGGDYSTGNQSGLYSDSYLTDTYTTEQPNNKHGDPTAYCGKLFWAGGGRFWQDGVWYPTGAGAGKSYTYGQSTSLGGADLNVRIANLDRYDSRNCDVIKNYTYSNLVDSAPCNYRGDTDRDCPKGWGSDVDYDAYRPGCRMGSYYPNPTTGTTTVTHYRDNLGARLRKS